MSHSVYGESSKPKLRTTYLERFHELDRDANGYLDMNEVAGDQLFRDLFTLFDKDGDGKIFEKELLAVVDDLEEVASAAANGIVLIDLNEASRGLFGLIDADGDGKLSIPELRAMAKLVERYGSAKDGTLTPRDLPRRFEASLSLGIGASRRTYTPQNPYMYGQNVPPRPQVGPMWFQKMDRNRDGFVSRREFLGTDEEFRKLDLNGDGLISVEEAEAAEKK
jgi:Ca2+-binding EF-hand superfamily protein